MARDAAESSTMNLVSIRSPFQLLCAMEYLLKHEIQNNYLIIRSNQHDAISQEQIKNLVLKCPDLFLKIGEWTQNSEAAITEILKNISSAKESRVIWTQPDDARNIKILKGLKPNSIVYVDDGTSTVNKLKSRKNFLLPRRAYKERIKSVFLGKLKGMTSSWYPFRPRLYCLLFTVFDAQDFGGVSVERNSLFHVGQYLSCKGIANCRGNVVWIIGSPYAEKSILSLSVEVRILEKAQLKLRENGADVLYIAHRYDSREKLNRLREIGFELKIPETCIEAEVLTAPVKPKSFAAIGSTALISLRHIYPDAELYRIDSKTMPDSFRNSVNEQYSAYEFLKLDA